MFFKNKQFRNFIKLKKKYILLFLEEHTESTFNNYLNLKKYKTSYYFYNFILTKQKLQFNLKKFLK